MAGEREHLEKLIFEVYGAEEGARKINDLRKAEDKHAKSIKGLKKEAKAYAKGEEANARKIAAAEKVKRDATKETLKVAAAGFAALAVAAAKASADLETANGKVERSFELAGASVAEMASVMADADKDARRLGLGLIDQREALAKLLDASGDWKKAQEDLKLVNDIAATGDIDRTQAVEALTKARKGEIEELKKLNGLSMTSISALQAIGDDATRGAAAIDKLKEAYSGAADELKDTNTAFDNLKEAATDLLAVIGDVGGGLFKATFAWTSMLGEEEVSVSNFATGLRNFAAEAKEASQQMDALLRWRAQAGGVFGEKSLMDFIGEVDAENAKRVDAAFRRTARTKETTGRSQTGRYGRGGVAKPEAPTPSPKPKGSRKEGDVDDLTDILERAQEQAEEEVRITQWLQDEKFRLSVEGSQMREREAATTLEINQQLAQDIAAVDKRAFDEKKAGLDAIKKAQIDSAMATADAVGGGIQTLSNSFVKGEGTKAVISGAVESARAIAAYAGGNIPGGIGHTAAAAAFFKVAADAGKGGGSTGASGRGAASSSIAARQNDSRENLQAVGRRDFGAQARAESYVININSAFSPRPDDARDLADAIESEMRNR